MTTLSRRSLLVGAAAIPAAVAIPALAATEASGPIVPQTANPDAKLFELMKKLEAVHARWKAFMDGPYRKAEKQYDKLAPAGKDDPSPWMKPLPRKIAKFLPPSEDGKKRTDFMVGELRLLKKIAPKHPVLALYKKHMDKRHAEWDAIQEKRRRILDETGIGRMDGEQERIYGKCYPIYDKIIRTRANTVAGIKIKIKATKLMCLDECGDLEREWASIIKDLLALSLA